MDTNRPTLFAPTIGQPFHVSQRSVIRENQLPTGERVRTIESSRLVMSWECGELRLRCDVSLVNLPGGMRMPTQRRRGL